ncbi:hypothetical protein TPHA_0K02160 [Tetrapisispora phaffii CBS 4417]|uniref:Major facilitator superfamily (MFS) profile domain-containing protein n=1 Tax=Tetrapisispora phaffii (strain ATCC 24235 / CBS 4417 / NBRC 1672 / NRRL Y-8282 / UCD 70-5) TaxID=1071381 RepID=G8BZL9_TETPH|nr:hypothetical protein TPHA_0K02160 [Tetrapisispora phaffii CBS 4417]CCE65347.1 hypothetical protein TPHA_0K02160 [Tetrapisispora phaffii CBS 4417]
MTSGTSPVDEGKATGQKPKFRKFNFNNDNEDTGNDPLNNSGIESEGVSIAPTASPAQYLGYCYDIERNGSSTLNDSTYDGYHKLEKINTLTSHSGTDIKNNRRMSRIQTGTQDVVEDFTKVQYENVLPMGGGRPFPPVLPNIDDFEVTFDGPFDPLHPFNWKMRKKVMICCILCLDSLSVSMASSIFASSIPDIDEIYGVIDVVAILGVTLFVLGFAFSPIIFAPLSELFGRQKVILISSFGNALFQYAVATAANLQTILICRFFAGLIGAAPIAVVPAVFADIFDTNIRGKAIALFSLGVFIGPILGPIIGSYIVQHTTWRWTEYVISFLSTFVTLLILLFLEETHHPIILVNKAKKLRKETNNWGIHASHENVELTIDEIITNMITRPLVMLVKEPVLLVVSIYNSFVYGILYLLLEAYPIVFIQGYGFTKNGELPYLALIIGMILCTAFIWYSDIDYLKRVEQNQGHVVPEARLFPMIVAGILFPIGLLWFTWTGNYYTSIHWIVPTIAGSFIGFGLIGIFLPCLNYIIESYLYLTASAVAANTFLRSAFGASFPLFAGYMFKGMGVNFAGLLLGLVAIVLIPVPLFLLRYGKAIRERSAFAYAG